MAKIDAWVRDLVNGLDAHADEATRAAVLGECGRKCISRSTVERARKLWEAHTDLDAWLEAMNAQHLGGGYLQRQGGLIYGRYERCYCSLAKGGGKGLSPTFCLCSRAWLEALFSGATGYPAQVEMIQTVVGGAPDCRYTVHLSGGATP